MRLDPAKAIGHRLIMLSGDESALRRGALASILAEAEIANDDFDLQTYDGETPPGEWVASAGTAPFLAARRTVVVRHLLRCDPEDALTLPLAGLPEYSLLILVADDEQGDDDRQKKLRGWRTAWAKLVEKADGMVVKCDANDSDLGDMVRAAAAEAGKRISPKAVQTLSELTSASVSRSLEEMPKLIAFVGAEEAIQESDVQAIVVPSREWNLFTLVDAAVAGDAGEALRQLRILVGSSAKAENVAFASIIPQLSRMLRLVWQARAVLDAGERLEAPSEETRDAFLRKPNLATEKPFVQGKAMRLARKVDAVQISRMLAIVTDIDSKIKGLLPAFNAMETLEHAVLQLAEVAGPAVAGSRRR